MKHTIEVNSFEYQDYDHEQHQLEEKINRIFNAIKSTHHRYFKTYIQSEKEFDLLRIKCRLENWAVNSTPDILGFYVEIDKLK